MKADRQIKVLLLAIVIFLALIAVRPYVMPMTARADSTAGYPLFIEPGVTMLSPAIFCGSFKERIIPESLIEAASSTDMSASVYECGWTWPRNRLLGKVKPNCLKSRVIGKFTL